VLAGEVTARSEPKSPASEFLEDAKAIYLGLKSGLTTAASVRATWSAMTVEGLEPNHTLGDALLALPPGQWSTVPLKAPPGGFSPGDYRVEIAVDNGPAQSLAFTVAPLLPPAVLVAPRDVPPGFNIALAALGGRVVEATSQFDETTWAAANLTDGVAFSRVFPRRGCYLSCGWSSKAKILPQEIVLAFHQERQALVHAVVIDTASYAAAVEGKSAISPSTWRSGPPRPTRPLGSPRSLAPASHRERPST
jgi:hypothetical protein